MDLLSSITPLFAVALLCATRFPSLLSHAPQLMCERAVVVVWRVFVSFFAETVPIYSAATGTIVGPSGSVSFIPVSEPSFGTVTYTGQLKMPPEHGALDQR